MIRFLFFTLLFLCSLQLYSQKLVYKSNGTILNSKNQEITPIGVREILANNEKLLANYNAGRTKKTVGNILLIAGSAFIVADLLVGATTDGDTTFSGNSIQTERNYPSALTFVGLTVLVVAIPIKIGFSNKIKKVVSDYNNSLQLGNNELKIQKTEFIMNQNGVGIRLTLN